MTKVWCDSSMCVMENGAAEIRIKDLSLRYGNTFAFKDISLELSSCSVTAFIGPSGCGKTSLLSCLNRMTDYLDGCTVAGEIKIGDVNILDAGADTMGLRKKIGMIFQKPNPFPMSIRKNISMPLKYHGVSSLAERTRLVEESLVEVGLWDEVKNRLDESALRLSGGQQQRLCIARAVALNPEILLMDEPCSALDPVSTTRIEELIRNLRKRMTVIVVTHNLAQARRIADNTVVFWNEGGVGHVLDQGLTERVFLNPVNKTVSSYLCGEIG